MAMVVICFEGFVVDFIKGGLHPLFALDAAGPKRRCKMRLVDHIIAPHSLIPQAKWAKLFGAGLPGGEGGDT